MKRCSNLSSPLGALALLLLICFLHCAAAARPLAAVPPLVHQESGVKAAAVDGDELLVSEMMGAEEAACEEGNDECLQRRLLHDAHLDYIYTQHKGGKP